MRIAKGTRDASGRWHADDPDEYPPMDVHGQLPWSVLDQSAKHWQDRKKWWAARGVDDLAPRAHAAGMIKTGKHGKTSGGVSRFDPFLTELLVTWLSTPGDTVYDPCAGGPVRGLVTEDLGRKYAGVDINPAQVEANRETAATWEASPTWIVGDGTEKHVEDETADMILTCPPYHNLEKYTDDPRDLSRMKWDDFVQAHSLLVQRSAESLRQDRFLAWVIGDIRDYKGHLRGLPAIAAQHIRDAGLHVINELILVAPTGTRAKTMRIPWTAARTTSRRHQTIIIAAKGDRKTAARRITNADQQPQA